MDSVFLTVLFMGFADLFTDLRLWSRLESGILSPAIVTVRVVLPQARDFALWAKSRPSTMTDVWLANRSRSKSLRLLGPGSTRAMYPFAPKSRSAILTLCHPDDMGRTRGGS